VEAIEKYEAECEQQGGILGMRADTDAFQPVCILIEPQPGDAICIRVGDDTILVKRSKLLAHLRATGLI
jgi:hypothetical protein